MPYITTNLRISFIVVLLGFNPPGHQMILHSVSQGEIVIPKKSSLRVMEGKGRLIFQH